ncbi:MAG: VOC family protein [Candidatus Delongbacteria bacterium]|nr:VOC family protein [Candidatus Delongbacteria bacterium]
MIGVKGMELVWFFVTDWNSAKSFYRDTLGFKLVFVDDDEGWAEFQPEESQTRLAIKHWRLVSPSPRGGGGCPVIQVEDLDKAIAGLEQQGVAMAGPIQAVEGMKRHITFYDPDGNPIQLTQVW